MPDLNQLNTLSLKIYKSSMKTEELWILLSKINNNYPQALTLYGEY